MAEHL